MYRVPSEEEDGVLFMILTLLEAELIQHKQREKVKNGHHFTRLSLFKFVLAKSPDISGYFYYTLCVVDT